MSIVIVTNCTFQRKSPGLRFVWCYSLLVVFIIHGMVEGYYVMLFEDIFYGVSSC